MKKVLSIFLLSSMLTLGGCFFDKPGVGENPDKNLDKNQEVTQTETNNYKGNEEGKENIPEDTTGSMVGVGESNTENPDEFNEDGQFEPKKFKDEDIDEVMNLLKDLINE